MLDLNKERLRHLMANAILELWKKETGSLSAVSIEGTICITTGSGRTVVIQVADRFTNSIPDFDSSHEKKLFGHRRHNSGGGLHFAPSVDTQPTSAAAMTAYLDDLSPASLVSPPADTPVAMVNHEHRSPSTAHAQQNNNNSSAQDSGIEVNATARSELSISQIQDNFMSDEEETHDSLNNSRNSTAGPVCAGTGYYTLDGKVSTQDKTYRESGKIKEEPMNETSGIDASVSDDFYPNEEVDIVGPLMSTPKNHLKQRSRDGLLVKSDALDLSRKEVDDLALSPPQNYTAQVRDVIRQRLLAQKFSSNQSRFEERLLSESPPKSESSPTESVLSNSVNSDGKDSQVSDSLPPTPVSNIPGSSLLSPDTNPMLVFPFPPFNQPRNLLYAGQIQEMIQRNVTFMSPMHSNPQAAFAERPSSEPMNLAQSPSTPDKLSLSFDGRHTPHSANGDQKIYSCDFCHKTFLFKSKYQEHLPVHTNARPYQCRLCSRTYKYKYDLRVHLRTHLGIPTKSTLCPFCNAKFDTNKLLRHHIKEVHREHHKALTEEQIQMFDAI